MVASCEEVCDKASAQSKSDNLNTALITLSVGRERTR